MNTRKREIYSLGQTLFRHIAKIFDFFPSSWQKWKPSPNECLFSPLPLYPKLFRIAQQLYIWFLDQNKIPCDEGTCSFFVLEEKQYGAKVSKQMELSQQFCPVLYQGKFSSVSYQIVREDKIQNSVRNTVQFVFLTLQQHRIPILFAKKYFWLLPQPVIIARLNREMCSLPLPFNNHLCFYYYYYYLFSIHLNLWEILLTNQCCPKLSLVLVVHTSIRRGKGVVGRSN